ncbi:MAG TPA: D-aminoacyl-tRNA deacylase [Thermoplasmata archaeon]|nr:D-aminoacyl-tRNA deacylase [Thermoplasmata archaeon]
MPISRFILVLSDPDPVAARLRDQLPMGEPTGEFVDGAAIRRLDDGRLVLRRAPWHIHDEHLDRRLPPRYQASPLPLVFPSVHRSERSVRCFTAHALGNLAEAEVGGDPGTLNPAPARLMTAILRQLAEVGRPIARSATFEATHHGPALETASMFAEIGFADDPAPSDEEVRALARALRDATEDPADRIAVGVGGGHYAPHFTELALERRWAFGHIISRHGLANALPGAIASASIRTEGSEGYLFHRASDGTDGPGEQLRPRLRDSEAPRRGTAPADRGTTSPSGASGPAVGT